MTELLPVAILAGGLATRLRPMTTALPKVLLEVQGQPFIAHQLRLLKTRGITHVVLCVGYLGEMVQAYVKDGSAFGIQVDYVFDGDRLLGTGGAIKQALPLLGDAFFVLYGDSYLPCDYEKIQFAFEKSHQQALMTVFRNDNAWDNSNIEFVDGQILAYDKRHFESSMKHIDYGIGVFRRSAFARVPDTEAYDLATLYQALLRDRQLAAFELHERFYEIGSLKGLKDMDDYLIATRGAL